MPTTLVSLYSLGLFAVIIASSSTSFVTPVTGFLPTVQYANKMNSSTGSSSGSSLTPAIHPPKKNPNQQYSTTSGSPSTVVSMMEGDGYGNYYQEQQQQQQQQQQYNSDETTEVRVEPGTHDELMYALGVNLARQLGDIRPLVESGEELAQVAKGLLDTVVGRLNDDGQRLLLSSRGKELDDLIVSRANVLREKLELRGREMLKNMAETEGVIVLDTGVCVHVLEHGPQGPGQGVRPTTGSIVLIHYHGTLSDGTVFDSTLGGDPVKFPLAQVIPGWRDGVLNMHKGETAMLGIPPEQGYGPDGTPDGRIPGGSTLFFKLQLVDVLTGAVGGDPTLLGADGRQLGGGGGPGLVGADGRPLY
ncbi:FKBP-type peptidyl-prolyl cis-trans isomerase [Nitzschia inconspicua]|uniref:peptidylprolyl isomerase n=1 Tax=Nitzschia inconspicua TaxID=303405 RepID=A0A9K3LPE0_9STRA|nr:FKBP-type peptidyl-prolyl cis-trans isomerase [Nitzschia inconspicua]